MGLGAVQFSHWFSPVRGGQGQGMKHDAFVNLDFSGTKVLKDIVVDFPGSLLGQSETDGSSYPTGGLRATHTAAAYTVW